MITNEERREVALRLGEYASGLPSTYACLIHDWINVLEYCGVRLNSATRREQVERLADLIDPTCKACRDTLCYSETMIMPEREIVVYRCSECGEIIGYDDYDPETDAPTYCETCGSRITGIGEPWDE